MMSVLACGDDANTVKESGQPAQIRSEFMPQSLADSVAATHGFEYWQDVERLDFRFDVAVDGKLRTQRNWTWFPKTDSVIRRADAGEVSFRRNSTLDSIQMEADAQFINDSYWLLMPFYLVWSKDGYSTEIIRNTTSPLDSSPRTKLTIQYDDKGGYTPGDAYDLYLNNSLELMEWVYRKGGQDEASMTMSWSDYRSIENLLLPTNHFGKGSVQISHPVVEVITRK
jgi:hypothetical protein